MSDGTCPLRDKGERELTFTTRAMQFALFQPFTQGFLVPEVLLDLGFIHYCWFPDLRHQKAEKQHLLQVSLGF